MAEADPDRWVRIEMELRIVLRPEPGRLSEALKALRRAGGRLYGHLVYRLEEDFIGLFVCERPAEGALALQQLGLAPETETVVLARAENRPGAVGHLVRALEAERIEIGYSYATSTEEEIFVVFRTDDNPKAEDVLRNYLRLPAGDEPPAGD